MINWEQCKPLSEGTEVDTIKLAAEGNKVAMDRVVKAYLKLAAQIAHNYKSFDGSNVQDLTSEATLGLLESIPLYDPDRGTKFSTFAAWRMRMRVLNRVLDDFRLVKIGTTQGQRKLFWRLNRETNNLRKEGLDPTSQAIADRLQVRVHEVESMQTRMSQPEASLDAPVDTHEVYSGATGTLFDLIDSGESSPEHYATKSRMTAWVQTQMISFEQRLSGHAITVWNHRIADDKLTLQAVADMIGCTRQYVSLVQKQLHADFVKYAKRQAR